MFLWQLHEIFSLYLFAYIFIVFEDTGLLRNELTKLNKQINKLTKIG